LDNMDISNGVVLWNVPFSRIVQDWEVEVVLSFFGLLYSSRRRHGGKDCIRWIPSKRKMFEVRRFFMSYLLWGLLPFLG
jgi:hypothetical protein